MIWLAHEQGFRFSCEGDSIGILSEGDCVVVAQPDLFRGTLLSIIARSQSHASVAFDGDFTELQNTLGAAVQIRRVGCVVIESQHFTCRFVYLDVCEWILGRSDSCTFGGTSLCHAHILASR